MAENLVKAGKMAGCMDCGMAYSFYFGTQFHTASCPSVRRAGVAIERRVLQGEATDRRYRDAIEDGRA